MVRNLKRSSSSALVVVVAVALFMCSGIGATTAKSATEAAPTATAARTVSEGIPKVKKDPRIANMLPASLRSKTTLTMATDATYAPLEFVASNGHTLQGLDIDLGNAIAQVFGLKAKFVNTPFDTIIPAVQSGKFAMAISSFNMTAERQKVVDQIKYYASGNVFIVRADNPPVKGLADLCGRTVSLQAGTAWIDDVNAQSAKCKAAGSKEITLVTFPSQDAANLALQSNRAQVGIQAAPAGLDLVSRSNGALKVTGSYGIVPHGIVTPKRSPLTKAVQAAVKKLMQNGVYAAIFKKWHMSSTTVKAPTINGTPA